MEPYDRDGIEQLLFTRKAIAEFGELPPQLTETDMVIFHCWYDLIYLDWLDRPSILYNHRGSRPHTFMLEEILQYRDPMRAKVIRKDIPWVLNRLSELLERPDVILSNSRFIQQQLRKNFGKESFVVYPPVDLERFCPCQNPTRDFFFSVQRVHWQKRIDTQIEAFAETEETLKIAGGRLTGGRKSRELKRLSEEYDNVQILGRVNDDELVWYLRNARAVVQTGWYEDFGLVPIEALASGTPCIVVDEAGFRETIHSQELGVRVQPPYRENLSEAVQSFDITRYDPELLREEAVKYGLERFKQEMDEYVKLAVERHHGVQG